MSPSPRSADGSPRSGTSVRGLLFALFGSLLLVTLGATTWLLVDGGERIVRDVVRQAATASQEAVRGEVESFLATGDAANHQVALSFRAPRVRAGDAPRVMQRLLRDIERITRIGTISNLYVGLADGRFYGLTANPDDWPAMYWRYTVASPRTDGRLAFYTDANDSLVGPELERTERFDPRARPWYVAAADARDSVWTDVYPNFGDGTPTITRAISLFGRGGERVGVAGADLFVPHLQRFLTSLELSDNSEVFLLDPAGVPLAAWGPAAGPPPPSGIVRIPHDALRFLGPALALLGGAMPPDAPSPRAEDPPSPKAPGPAESLAVAPDAKWEEEPGPPLAARPATAEAADLVLSGPVRLDGERGYLSLSTLDSPDTPPWRVGVFVPSADYLESVGEQVRRVVPLGIAIVLFALGAYALFATLVSRPLERLGAAAGRIATGRFDEPVRAPPGREVGTLARAIDDMRRRLGASFEALDTERERATTTLQAIEDAVVAIDADDRVTLVNRAAERLLGHVEADVRGEPIERVLVARDARSGLAVSDEALRGELAATRRAGLDVVLEGREGEERHARLSVAPLGGRIESRGALLVLHDLTTADRLRAELAWAASHDALTELINRRELEARIGRALDEARESDTRHALALFDLERFGRVNDEIGHAGGDELLRQVARTVERRVARDRNDEGPGSGGRQVVTVARLGAAEFAVLVEGRDAEAARPLFESIRDAIVELRFVWTERGFRIGVSVGTVELDAATPDAGSALGDAGAACALARESGTNRVLAYGADAGRRRDESGQLRLIDRGIEDGHFELVAQEVVALAGDAPPDVELLLRLRAADGELLSPAHFLSAAERLGAIGRIDRHVVELAFASLAARPASERGIGRCAINLSGITIGDETFLPWLLDALARHPIDPATLVFEVTETATVSHLSSARRLMETLSGRGVEFALDDFGTGLCSFAYLRTLPIDRLKIDGTFVRGMLSGPRDRALVRSMIELGRSLGLATVAECVEDEATLEALRALGVDRAQGYHLHRPASFDP